MFDRVARRQAVRVLRQLRRELPDLRRHRSRRTRPSSAGSTPAGSSCTTSRSTTGIAYLNAWDAGFVVDFTTPDDRRTLLGRWSTTPTSTSHSNWTTTVAGRHIALHGEEATARTSMSSTSIRRRDVHAAVRLVEDPRLDLDPQHHGVRRPARTSRTTRTACACSTSLIRQHPRLVAYYNTWDPQGPTSTSDVLRGRGRSRRRSRAQADLRRRLTARPADPPRRHAVTTASRRRARGRRRSPA